METEENYKDSLVRPRICPDTFFEQRSRSYVEQLSDTLSRWSMKRDAARPDSYSYGLVTMAQISFEALIGSHLMKKVPPSTDHETSLPFSQETPKLLLCK